MHYLHKATLAGFTLIEIVVGILLMTLLVAVVTKLMFCINQNVERIVTSVENEHRLLRVIALVNEKGWVASQQLVSRPLRTWRRGDPFHYALFDIAHRKPEALIKGVDVIGFTTFRWSVGSNRHGSYGDTGHSTGNDLMMARFHLEGRPENEIWLHFIRSK